MAEKEIKEPPTEEEVATESDSIPAVVKDEDNSDVKTEATEPQPVIENE